MGGIRLAGFVDRHEQCQCDVGEQTKSTKKVAMTNATSHNHTGVAVYLENPAQTPLIFR